MDGPAVRSYGGLPALRADPMGSAPTTSPPYHCHRVYFSWSVSLHSGFESRISLDFWDCLDFFVVLFLKNSPDSNGWMIALAALFGSNVEMQGILEMPCSAVQFVKKWKAS